MKKVRNFGDGIFAEYDGVKVVLHFVRRGEHALELRPEQVGEVVRRLRSAAKETNK